MEFKKKASITVTGTASAAEVLAAARAQPGFESVITDAVRRGAEAGGSTAGLKLVSSAATFADDGSASVDLVYEKDEAAPVDVGQGTTQPEQQATQNGQGTAGLPLDLLMPGPAPAAA